MDFKLLPGYNLPDENHTTLIMGMTISFTVAALCAVLARIWVRTKKHLMGWDDYTIGVAMALSILGFVFVIRQLFYGLGRHLAHAYEDVGWTGIKSGLRLAFESQIVYSFANACIKASIGFLLIRFSRPGFHRTYIRVVMGLTAFYTVVTIVALLVACKPSHTQFGDTLDTTCNPKKFASGVALLDTILNVITDIFFAIMPVFLFWDLNVNQRTKYSLWATLSLGFLAAIAGVVKLCYIIIEHDKTIDFMWANTNVIVWTAIECNVGIMAASFPALKPLFKKILGEALSSVRSTEQ